MSEYPEEIMKAARKLCDDVIKAWLLHHSREEAAEIAASALIAERNRCAEVVDARLPLYTEIGQINALRECASSIRGGAA